MTNKETVNRNIGLTFDFARQIVENPGMIERLKDNAVIEFLQKDYPVKEPAKQIKTDSFIKVKRNFELI